MIQAQGQSEGQFRSAGPVARKLIAVAEWETGIPIAQTEGCRMTWNGDPSHGHVTWCGQRPRWSWLRSIKPNSLLTALTLSQKEDNLAVCTIQSLGFWAWSRDVELQNDTRQLLKLLDGNFLFLLRNFCCGSSYKCDQRTQGTFSFKHCCYLHTLQHYTLP